MNRFNLSLLIVLCLLIAGLWTCNSCQKAKIAELEARQMVNVAPVQVTAVDTVWKHDTFIRTAYVPKPYAIHKTDTLVEFLDRVEYRDTTHTTYGAVYISDTVEGNRITGRSVVTDFKLPMITQTVTIPQKPKAAVFLGLNFQGKATDYVQAFGPSLMLKTKQDRIIELGALYSKSGEVIYQAGIKFKISFNKK